MEVIKIASIKFNSIGFINYIMSVEIFQKNVFRKLILFIIVLVSLLISRILKSGKKLLQKNIVYQASEIIKKNKWRSIKCVWKSNTKCQSNWASCQLVVQLTKFLLKLVDSEQQTYLYVIRYADQRVGRSMSIKLANEIIDTANDIGNTIKKRKKLINGRSK
jgi:small subunit ribosomal protein S7